MSDLLTIGEIARRSGVASSALRFYEQRGLITSERAGSGHRRYPRAVLRRIAFIVFAQRIGLTLEEIGAELAKPLPTMPPPVTTGHASPPPGARVSTSASPSSSASNSGSLSASAAAASRSTAVSSPTPATVPLASGRARATGSAIGRRADRVVRSGGRSETTRPRPERTTTAACPSVLAKARSGRAARAGGAGPRRAAGGRWRS